MKLVKKGLILSTKDAPEFGAYRLMCPTPISLSNNVIRVFLGFCDENGISRPGYVDVDANNPKSILNISPKPLLEVGRDGTFDDNGLCPTSIVVDGNNLLMYYFGFQLGVKIPFYMFSGMAVSSDNGLTWEKTSEVPVLDRSNQEPIMRSGPFVIKETNKYKVYYPCGKKFIDVNGKKVHSYQIHYCESSNGRIWPDSGIPVIKFQSEDEYGFGRPFVIWKNGMYIMLYSIRTRSLGYRLGYADSLDGINWNRKDHEMDIDVSKDGWDSQMLCYSSIIQLKNKTYIFYNGNNLGGTGFGFAKLIS